jgi:molecular chaperone DnaJ
MNTRDRDYYEVLGVPRDADEKAVKEAYHKLAMHWHPDRNPAPNAEEKFKEIAKAYAILKDPKKRARYDTQGMEGVAHFTAEDLFADLDLGGIFGDFGFGRDTGFGGGDIFDRMFGFGQRARRPTHGQDLRVSIEVPLETIYSGGKQEIRISHPVSCEACHGYGTHDGKAPPPCPNCEGTGRHVEAKEEKRGEQQVRFQQITVCPVCHGKGTRVDEPCKTCGGYGKVEKEELLNLNIPSGIEDATVLRVPGHGLPANEPGLPPGDLHVSVYSRPDVRFQRRGADLWRAETIEVEDAVLGTKIQVPTLGGRLNVKIPAGIQPDEILRLQGKGLPRFRDSGYGDLNLRIVVHVPEELTHAQKTLYKQLKKISEKNKK